MASIERVARRDNDALSRLDALICLVLAVATFALFWPSLGFEFVDFDDLKYVVHNELIRDGRVDSVTRGLAVVTSATGNSVKFSVYYWDQASTQTPGYGHSLPRGRGGPDSR